MKLTERDAVKTRQFASSARTAVDDQRHDLGRRRRQRLPPDAGRPQLDEVEIWELRNKSGGWFHPVHIHLIDFKILDRNGKPPLPRAGPEGRRLRRRERDRARAMRFGPHTGRYMMHCHNLVHEDHDMMVQFNVVGDIELAGDDPRLEDTARPLPFPDFYDEDLDAGSRCRGRPGRRRLPRAAPRVGQLGASTWDSQRSGRRPPRASACAGTRRSPSWRPRCSRSVPPGCTSRTRDRTSASGGPTACSSS